MNVSETSAEIADGKNTMPIAGGVIGGIIVIGVLAVVIAAIKNKKKTPSENR